MKQPASRALNEERVAQRLARRLTASEAFIEVDSEGARWLVAGGRVAVTEVAFRHLQARGALQASAAGHHRLSDAGLAMVRRQIAGGEDLAALRQTRGHRRLGDEDDRRLVTVDLGESPLAWLRSRKGRDGAPMIDDAAFDAGERLRADFTRGQLMPSITTNWSAASSGGRRSGHAGGSGDLTEAALSARLRVERALTALGPELSGTVVDFCCFLKGIETIERERNWPKRSAKLVLQLGLAALARHYGFAREAGGPSRAGRGSGDRRSGTA